MVPTSPSPAISTMSLDFMQRPPSVSTAGCYAPARAAVQPGTYDLARAANLQTGHPTPEFSLAPGSRSGSHARFRDKIAFPQKERDAMHQRRSRLTAGRLVSSAAAVGVAAAALFLAG